MNILIVIFFVIPSFTDETQTVGVGFAGGFFCVCTKEVFFKGFLLQKLAVSGYTVCGAIKIKLYS